ncbi:hypothetical protein SAMN04487983_10107 [Streptomyces sp. yr375]|nr:hypothetical protein SAMN04487983_10107 [Streptomyces sp. yr375]
MNRVMNRDVNPGVPGNTDAVRIVAKANVLVKEPPCVRQIDGLPGAQSPTTLPVPA